MWLYFKNIFQNLFNFQSSKEEEEEDYDDLEIDEEEIEKELYNVVKPKYDVVVEELEHFLNTLKICEDKKEMVGIEYFNNDENAIIDNMLCDGYDDNIHMSLEEFFYDLDNKIDMSLKQKEQMKQYAIGHNVPISPIVSK